MHLTTPLGEGKQPPLEGSVGGTISKRSLRLPFTQMGNFPGRRPSRNWSFEAARALKMERDTM